MAIASGVFWAKGAEFENISPVYWAGPSVLISGIIIFGLSKGWVAVLLGHVALFAAVTAYRMLKDKNEAGD